MPAAKVTACCPAMPTSKTRARKRFAMMSTPVPAGIAAVIATIRGSRAASSVRALPKTEVKLGALAFDAACVPVGTSKLATP